MKPTGISLTREQTVTDEGEDVLHEGIVMHAGIGTSSLFVNPRALPFPVASTGMPHRPLLEDILAANVKALCRQRGFWHDGEDEPNQSELARQTKRAGKGINQSTIARVLAAERDTKLPTIEALAAGLGVPAWHLLVPQLNAAETTLVTSAEAVERAYTKVNHRGKAEQGPGVPRRAPHRDGKKRGTSSKEPTKRGAD